MTSIRIVHRSLLALQAAAAAACVVMFAPAAAYAAEIKVVATAAVSGAFKDLIPQFERTSGHKVTLQYPATPVVMRQIESGEPFDLAIGLASGIQFCETRTLHRPPAAHFDRRLGGGRTRRRAEAGSGSAQSFNRRCSTPSPSPSCRKA